MPDAEREFAEQSLTREQGRRPRMRLSFVQLRLGSRFFSVWWLLPGLLILGGALVVAAKVFIVTGAGQSFIHAHPCVASKPHVNPGVEWWVIVTHLANFFFMVMIVRAGWQILADHPRLYVKVDCTPDRELLRFRGPIPRNRVWTAKDDAITLSPLVGMPGGRHTIGVARHWHFIFDILFVLNGIVYVVLLFATGRYLKLASTELAILPDAASCIVQYSALHLPTASGGYFRCDAIQQLSYFGVVFLLGPLAILSGLGCHRRWITGSSSTSGSSATVRARTLHFLIMCAFLAFYAVHMIMVASTGFASNLDSISLGTLANDLNGVALLLVALGVTIAFNVWAVRFSWTHTRVLQQISNATVGRLMDLLFDRYAPRAEYREQDISPFFWVNGLVPTSDEWTGMRDREFRDYRLRVHGLVEHPVELSLQELRDMAHQEQITMHNCIQGWSAIGKWSGAPFAKLIELVRPHPEAEWVMFLSYGEGGEGGSTTTRTRSTTYATRRACSPTR